MLDTVTKTTFEGDLVAVRFQLFNWDQGITSTHFYMSESSQFFRHYCLRTMIPRIVEFLVLHAFLRKIANLIFHSLFDLENEIIPTHCVGLQPCFTYEQGRKSDAIARWRLRNLTLPLKREWSAIYIMPFDQTLT